MRELEVAIPSPFGLAGVLCVPEDARDVPAVVLVGGSGADSRDGDLQPGRPGTLRRIAHSLAGAGVATLRWDRRGFGRSGGRAAHADYDSDLEDALAALRWLRDREEVDPERVAVAGHSAGALTACRVCRDGPGLGGAILLGALASPIEDMLRWNLGRAGRHWDQFTPEQRAWLEEHVPDQLVRGEGLDRYLEGARRGEPTVVLEGHGVRVEMRTARTGQDLATSYEDEFRHVGCPALVLHGGEDLNVPVADALTAYRALRDAGNDEVTLIVLPGLDHYFNRAPADPSQRIWERVSLEYLGRPMAPEALDAIARWAVRALSGGHPASGGRVRRAGRRPGG